MAAPAPASFVLASASPRRKQLLGELGFTFDILSPDIDESVRSAEPADAYVLRLAREKAAQVAGRAGGRPVLAADTTVVLDGEILGKPGSKDEARAMLTKLSGRTHDVFTGVALAGAAPASTLVRTQVTFRPLSAAEIHWYVETGEPMDKAGAYAIQGKAAAFVARIDGSPTNVIGLPLGEALELLARAGVKLPW
jgi:septum formation protein